MTDCTVCIVMCAFVSTALRQQHIFFTCCLGTGLDVEIEKVEAFGIKSFYVFHFRISTPGFGLASFFFNFVTAERTPFAQKTKLKFSRENPLLQLCTSSQLHLLKCEEVQSVS